MPEILIKYVSFVQVKYPYIWYISKIYSTGLNFDVLFKKRVSYWPYLSTCVRDTRGDYQNSSSLYCGYYYIPSNDPDRYFTKIGVSFKNVDRY